MLINYELNQLHIEKTQLLFTHCLIDNTIFLCVHLVRVDRVEFLDDIDNGWVNYVRKLAMSKLMGLSNIFIVANIFIVVNIFIVANAKK